MKKAFNLSVFVLTFLGLLLCCSAQAQTWKELLDQADSLHKAAAYDSAIVVGKLALEKAEKEFGENDTTVASVLSVLGKCYYFQTNYTEAESVCNRALAIRSESLGSDHPDVAISLNHLANVYSEQGKCAEAERLHKRALVIREKALGPDHPDVAQSLINMANLYRDQGRYTEAEPLYKRALPIFEKTLGLQHPYGAITLISLANLYWYQGKYPEAEPLYKRALPILEKTLGPDHPSVAFNLNDLANLYADQRRYGEAEPLYKRALGIREKTFGQEHPLVAASLNNLALLYSEEGKYTEAEPLYKKALAVLEKTLGLQHPYGAITLINLADLYTELGKYTEAEPLHKQALAIMENALGPDHPYTADALHSMALLLKNKKQFIDAKETAQKAYSIRRKNLRNESRALSEKDALTYSKFMREEACQYISILLDSDDTSLRCKKEIAEVVFSTKGQVSDGIYARHRTQVYEKDPSLKAMSDSLRYAQFKLANLYVQGPDEEDFEGYKEKLRQASEEKERLEAELARQSAEFRRELELWEVDVEKVAGALPLKSILVEYLKYDRLKTNRETEPHYLLVVVNNQREVFISDLGSSNQIDSIVAMYRSHFQEVATRGGSPFDRDLENYKKISAKLYERIWKPVEDRLGNANLVFIAPDGALNLVSFAGLTDEAGKYLIESYPIQYLSSGRDLIRLKEVGGPGDGLFALGDPNFNASASDRLSSEATLAQAQESDTSVYTLRNIRSGCEELSKIAVLPLPGTHKEIERVSYAWEKKTKEPCYTYFGVNASEDNFKTNAPGNKVIHLATHGYYAQSECLRELPQEKLRMTEFVGENPLLLSGLFLAGANLHGEGADSLGVEDGILTAEEVTGMDLEGTRWVVLSACESGLGEVKSGEGVYGLRRAFQMAGARTVISALWPVSDKTTAETMSYLYGYKEDNLAMAMQNLAKKNLAELRKKHQPDHPYLWAPFIALGDWK